MNNRCAYACVHGRHTVYPVYLRSILYTGVVMSYITGKERTYVRTPIAGRTHAFDTCPRGNDRTVDRKRLCRINPCGDGRLLSIFSSCYVHFNINYFVDRFSILNDVAAASFRRFDPPPLGSFTPSRRISRRFSRLCPRAFGRAKSTWSVEFDLPIDSYYTKCHVALMCR